MGRKKLWTIRITLPLDDDTVARVDEQLFEGETRLDMIRDAIERELTRRKRYSWPR